MRWELRTGTPGNVPGEAETGLFCVLRAGSGSQGGTGGQPAMRLPVNHRPPSGGTHDSSAWPVVRPADPRRPWPSPFSRLGNPILCVLGRGEEGGMGQTRAPGPRPRAFTVRASVSPCLWLCVFAFSKRRTSIFVGGVGGREGKRSLTSPASCVWGRLGATEEAVGGAQAPLCPTEKTLT